MIGFLIVLFALILLVGIVGLVLFAHSRKILREQKNYERALKMVPLLIHLPPQSEDVENSGRDARELLDENISKAQIVYNIIASTLQKGFKSQFYGQRHFAFEIVGSKGFVHFYAAVPVALVEVVKQAIVSAYPSARLEEVAEHNIFSPIGKINGTIGGELTLKENYAYPIATFQDLKRDALQSLLNALSTLDKEDGAGIQILMRPANPDWRKKAQGLAGKKRKGEESKKGTALVGEWGKQLGTALVKPPEDKGGGKSEPKQLSSHEQTTLDAIDQKTSYPGYEVLIRVVVSSNISQRAQAILGNVVASFSLFDAPGRNGFKYTPAKDIESFVTAYIMRFFPQENTQNVLNTVELATIFHFPDQKNIPTTQLERQASKQVDGPRNIADEGTFLGYNVFRGVKKPIRLDENDRRRHMYLVGQTGTGKSTMLENLALQDMLNGKGFAFIDPHGDVAEELLAMVPKERTEDVIYFCPADMDYPLGLNLFEFDNPDQKDFLIQEAINMLYKLYDPQHTGIIGPRYEHWFRNAALTIMANPEGGTFIDIPKVFTDKQYEKELKKHVTDQTVLDFWNKEMAQTSDYHKSEVLGWFVSKFGAFLSNEMMRNIIGQTKSSFNLREIMDEGKILLVNLSKGRTGELNSKLLGMIFVMKFQAAAMSRADIKEDERKDFSLYVDEFQNFSTDSFATILSEARKYRLNLIVANQFTTQLTDEIRDAVFGNIGTVISYRVGTNDADFLTKQFAPVFDSEDLQRIPNYNTVARMLIGGIPTQPFSMAAMPKLGKPNKKLMEALKQLSAAKYGRPRSQVETEIFARIRTADLPTGGSSAPGAARPGAPVRPGGAFPQAGAGRPPVPPRPAAPGSASFLDDWLSKRQAPAPARPPGAAPGAGSAWGAPQGQPSTPVYPQAPAAPYPAAQPSFQPLPTTPTPPPLQPLPATPVQPASVPPVQPVSPLQAPQAPLATHPATPATSAPAAIPQASHASQAPVSPAGAPPVVPQSHPAAPSAPMPADAKTAAPPPIEPQVAPLEVRTPPPDAETANLVKEVQKTLSGAPVKNSIKGTATSQKPAPADESAPDDTIFIDTEGTLHINQDDTTKDTSAAAESTEPKDTKPAV